MWGYGDEPPAAHAESSSSSYHWGKEQSNKSEANQNENYEFY